MEGANDPVAAYAATTAGSGSPAAYTLAASLLRPNRNGGSVL